MSGVKRFCKALTRSTMPSETGLCFAGPKNRWCKARDRSPRSCRASSRFAEFFYEQRLSPVSVFKCGSGRMRAREAFPSSARVSSAESGSACLNHSCRQPGKTSPFCTSAISSVCAIEFFVQTQMIRVCTSSSAYTKMNRFSIEPARY